MDQNKARIEQLYHLWLNGQASEAGTKELFILLDKEDPGEMLDASFWQIWNEPLPHDPGLEQRHGIILTDILHTYPSGHRHSKVFALRKWLVAASLVAVMASGALYFYFSNRTDPATENPISAIPSVAPGKDGAVLTLSDGSRLVLDSLGNGDVATQEGAKARIADGVLVYEGHADKTVYNTLSTPRGRQYQLTLPDGSGVWLNAASSITYPVAFTGKERKVTITGEVYFEIAANKSKPFIVDANGNAMIEVLGTAFNINAYDNEKSLDAALLQGSVAVSKGGERVVLKPAQKAIVTTSINVQELSDPATVIAWKDGVFDFSNVDFEAVMRQLERWYDIEVVYNGAVPEKNIHGKMHRDVQLSDIIFILEKAGIDCQLQGKKLIISKK